MNQKIADLVESMNTIDLILFFFKFFRFKKGVNYITIGNSACIGIYRLKKDLLAPLFVVEYMGKKVSEQVFPQATHILV